MNSAKFLEIKAFHIELDSIGLRRRKEDVRREEGGRRGGKREKGEKGGWEEERRRMKGERRRMFERGRGGFGFLFSSFGFYGVFYKGCRFLVHR